MVRLGCIKLDDGTATHAEQLVDRHAGLAQHNGKFHLDAINIRKHAALPHLSRTRGAGYIPARLCRILPSWLRPGEDRSTFCCTRPCRAICLAAGGLRAAPAACGRDGC